MRNPIGYLALSLLAAAFAGCSSTDTGTNTSSSGVDPLTGELAKYNAAVVPLSNACTWDSSTGALSVKMVATELAMISVRKVDKAMLVNGTVCADTQTTSKGNALSTNVKSIVVGGATGADMTGAETVILDLRNGTFALKGATSGGISIDLGGGADEVAVVGSTTANKYGCLQATGKDTLGLKSATSGDVTIATAVTKYTIDLNDGDDSFDQGDCPTIMSISGGAGKDTIIASATVVNKADIYSGGLGADTLDYSKRTVSAAIPVLVNMDPATADGYNSGAEGDTIGLDIETIKGTAGSDTFIGPTVAMLTTASLTSQLYVFTGGDGDDTFTTSKGAGCTINGGAGTDTVDYSARAGAVTVTMDGAKANDGEDKDVDNIGKDVENLKASAHGDTVTGNAMNNVFTSGILNDMFTGGDGDDTFIATVTDGTHPADGDDTFIGGPGNDTIDYSAHYDDATAIGVCVTLDGKATSGTCTVTDGGAAVSATAPVTGDLDTVGADVENVIGTPKPDYIVGNAYVNTLVGFGGADWIVGGAANDQIDVNTYYAKSPNGYYCGDNTGAICSTVPGGAVPAAAGALACDCTGLGMVGNDVCNQFTGVRIGAHAANTVACTAASGAATNARPYCPATTVSASCGGDPLDVVSCSGTVSGNDATGSAWSSNGCWKTQL